MYYSSRNPEKKVSASFALLHGLASDGGLFLMDKIPHFDVRELLSLSYPELAKKILLPLFDDFTKEEIEYCVEKAYGKENFPDGLVGVESFQNHSFLELFKGPTLAFKDMALTLLPFLMEVAMKHLNKEKLTIVTATSGDTGSAALSAFSRSDKIQIKVLYPDGGISPIQEKQMLYFTSSCSRAYVYKEGNFDDCQRLAKECLSIDKENLSSANSINIGRLLPQTIYYFYAYCQLVNKGFISLGEEIDVIVPTGNFGNIFALYLSKKMGLPISHLVCASNKNDVLTEFFHTGKYDARRELFVTNSPSMDILVSSNLERLLSLILPKEELLHCMNDLMEKKVFTIKEEYREKLNDFLSCSSDEEATLKAMSKSYKEDHYLIDPHTAVAYDAYLQLKENLPHHVLIAATASFYKFPKAVGQALKLDTKDEDEILDIVEDMTGVKHPVILDKVRACKTERIKITREEFKKELFQDKELIISTPATSANLGPGFDICGLSYSLYNTYSFTRSSKDEVEGFDEKYDCEHNLVLKAYRYLFKKYQLVYQPVKIKLLSQDIPVSRGLGSSAACIVAGIVGANAICNNKCNQEQLLSLMIEMEGHGDNVTPCYLGGYQSVLQEGEEFIHIQREINKKWNFYLFIPEKRVSTQKARGILPKNYSMKDIVFNLSRVSLLPDALKGEDIFLLRSVLEDKLHQPYRLSLIPEGDKVMKFALLHDGACCISGSGSTMLIISLRDDLLEEFKKEKFTVQHKVLKLNAEEKKVIAKEVYHG